jgi:hypothetical protein
MAEDFLTRHRSKVYQLLVDHAPEGTAISLYLPDDLAEQPAVIIGRPAASFRGTDLGVEVRVPVHVLGRTFNDDGSQIEHDQLTDVILGVLWDYEMPLIAVLPTIQSVAGKAYPAYDITTLHAHTVCPC